MQKNVFFIKQNYVNLSLSSSRDTTVFVHVAFHSSNLPQIGCEQSEPTEEEGVNSSLLRLVLFSLF